MANQQQNKTRDGDSTVRTGMQGSQELEAEGSYWRENFRNEPYYAQGREFDDYAPAYRLGGAAREQHRGSRFEDVEAQLRSQYEADRKGQDGLDWTQAKPAVRAAWDRSGSAEPGGGDALPAGGRRPSQQPH